MTAKPALTLLFKVKRTGQVVAVPEGSAVHKRILSEMAGYELVTPEKEKGKAKEGT